MTHNAEQLDPGAFGPVFRGGRGERRSGWGRLGRWALAAVTAVTLTAVAAVGVLVYVGGESVERVSVPGLAGNREPDPAVGGQPADAAEAETEPALQEVDGVTNILLVGSDSRAGLSEAQLLRLGTEEDEGGTDLTDTVMLVQLDAEDQQVSVLGFPRDLLVTRCDGSKGRINSAFSVGEQQRPGGGPDCLVQTVTDLTDVPIDHYVEVDLAGFIEAVDAVGGVTFHIDEPIVDRWAGLDLEPGCVTFDGERALGFVRARHIDNDYGRIARTQRFMRELWEQATDVETLANPQRILSLVRAVGGSLRTDDQLSTLQLARLAYTFRSLPADGLQTRVVPSEPGTWGAAEVVYLDRDAAEELFTDFRRAATPTPTETASPRALPAPELPTPELPTPEEVSPLVVLNGAGVDGLATAASEAFTEYGFQVARAADAERFDFSRTQVRYPPDLRAEAQALAAAVGGVRLVAGEPGGELTVILGPDFDPAQLTATSPEGPGDGPGDAPEAPGDDDGELPRPDPAAGYATEYKGATVSEFDCEEPR